MCDHQKKNLKKKSEWDHHRYQMKIKFNLIL